MSIRPRPQVIRLRGVRQNNLKNFDLDLPLRQLIVLTGLSGSGKSSLAFDTLFAEGQRRYIETFSPYARQFFDRMDKPQVDSIEGIPPAIAIEQRNSVKSTRSTVGTMTELADYLKNLWPHISRLHCRGCHQPVAKDTPQSIWTALLASSPVATPESLVTFDLPLSDKLSLDDSLALIARQGYQRLLVGPSPLRIDDAAPQLRAAPPSSLTVIQDRLRLVPRNRARFVEACEQAYHFGKGHLAVHRLDAGLTAGDPARFSQRFHCAACNLEYREPSPALFSYNHPLGACPACRGFGRIIQIDYQRAVPDHRRTLAQGVVKPWLTGHGMESQRDLMKFCRKRGVPTDVPFAQLPPDLQRWVIDGDPGYGQDSAHQWPRAWYGVKGYFRWLESKSYKMHYRVLLARYRAYTTCPECHGNRFQPESLLHRAPNPNGAGSITLADFYRLTLDDATAWIQSIQQSRTQPQDPLRLVIDEIQSRLQYLLDVGLGYLTLDRPTRSLSGGETERVNLTACLGTRLVNTLFVLDEPTVGLHHRDTLRLVRILEQLRDLGNTVVVVEHEPAVMQAADRILDLGPGHGETGGHLIFEGRYSDLLKHPDSLTAQHLDRRRSMPAPPRRPVSPPPDGAWLVLTGVSRHNLHNLTVHLPLARFVAISGVSGSGKSTLVRDILYPALLARLNSNPADARDASDSSDPSDLSEPANLPPFTIAGAEHIHQIVLVDQSSLGRTPRSNPAVYVGAFDHIRAFFADTETARRRGLNPSSFSFNSAQGQCERCRGAGFEKIEMQFLSDVFIRCPDCDGRRYRPHVLEARIPAPHLPPPHASPRGSRRNPQPPRSWNIADLLDSGVDLAIDFLDGFKDSRHASRASAALRRLQDVGLGYLRLGQPVNTLSGGECQRLKLAAHLADFETAPGDNPNSTLFLFDEPTTGLHLEDVRILLQVFQRLVDLHHTVLVVEHHLDVLHAADWIVDLGPEAGARGGQIVAAGTPETLAAHPDSHTGRALRSR